MGFGKIQLFKIKYGLTVRFIYKWRIECDANTSCYMYRLIRTNFGFENYLTKIPCKLRKFLINFRTKNHRLPIEIGRWKRIPRELRICHLCRNELGDEFHYLLTCKCLSNLRKQYLPSYCHKNPNILKLRNLMNNTNISVQRKLSFYKKKIYIQYSLKEPSQLKCNILNSFEQNYSVCISVALLLSDGYLDL